MCGVLTFCWTSAIRLPPPAVVLSLSTCLYQLVCINLSLWTCLYKFVSINLSLSTCLYQLVCINLSLSTCLHQLVSINLSLSICLYQLVSGRLGCRSSFARQARHLVTLSACLPLYPSLFPVVGWCVRLPEGLASLCLPLCPFLFLLVGWCVLLPEGMVCPPSQGLVSPCRLPLSPIFLFPFLGSRARPLGVLSPLVSHWPPWSPFSPIVSPHVCLCWTVCLPSRSLVSPCLPSCLSLSPVVSNSFHSWSSCRPADQTAPRS